MSAAHTSELSYFQNVATMQNNFYLDRPALANFNRRGSNNIDLLSTEVEELQGEPEYGLSIYEYRSQEISDVWLFARNMLNRFKREVDEQYVLYRCLQLIGSVSPARGDERESLEPLYQQILEGLNMAMHDLRACCGEEKYSPELYFGLQEIISHATCLFFLIGKDPADACLEKIARNMLKYPANEFPSGVQYEDVAPRVKNRWKKQIKGDEKFYSPFQEGTVQETWGGTLQPDILVSTYLYLQRMPHTLLSWTDRIEAMLENVERTFSWAMVPRSVKLASVRVAKGIGNRLR
jgi:hypothetical protein